MLYIGFISFYTKTRKHYFINLSKNENENT